MSLLFVFARAYPWQSLVMLACLLLATVAEGIGLSSLLPLLSLAAQAGMGASTGPDSLVGKGGLAHVAGDLLLSVGLEPSIGLLLVLIVGGMTLKAGFILLAQKQIGYTVAQVATDLV
jgi:ATP-binding cassette, subfamily C, bacterial